MFSIIFPSFHLRNPPKPPETADAHATLTASCRPMKAATCKGLQPACPKLPGPVEKAGGWWGIWSKFDDWGFGMVRGHIFFRYIYICNYMYVYMLWIITNPSWETPFLTRQQGTTACPKPRLWVPDLLWPHPGTSLNCAASSGRSNVFVFFWSFWWLP